MREEGIGLLRDKWENMFAKDGELYKREKAVLHRVVQIGMQTDAPCLRDGAGAHLLKTISALSYGHLVHLSHGVHAFSLVLHGSLASEGSSAAPSGSRHFDEQETHEPLEHAAARVLMKMVQSIVTTVLMTMQPTQRRLVTSDDVNGSLPSRTHGQRGEGGSSRSKRARKKLAQKVKERCKELACDEAGEEMELAARKAEATAAAAKAAEELLKEIEEEEAAAAKRMQAHKKRSKSVVRHACTCQALSCSRWLPCTMREPLLLHQRYAPSCAHRPKRARWRFNSRKNSRKRP